MLERYSFLNGSFKPRLIYHLGGEAGFFSEYNNMILAMLYCLKHNIRFELYSRDANFGYAKGWNDYFSPFCNEAHSKYHSLLNFRQIIYRVSWRYKIISFLFKRAYKIDYLTYELFSKFHCKSFEVESFDFPEIGVKGKTREAAAQLISMTWKFIPNISKEINDIINALKLPSQYVGIHIRGGDKVVEAEAYSPELYIDIAMANHSSRNYFILTDDYNVILKLKNKYREFVFYTLCNPEDNGYYHSRFTSLDSEKKRSTMINFFASIEVLKSADFFVGTYSSNPGMFMGMVMPEDKIKCVDLEKWTIW